MIKFAICDDCLENIERLSMIIDTFFKNREVNYEIKQFQCGNKLVEFYKSSEGNRFDIIFLDIIMEKSNGIDCAKEIRDFDSLVKIIMVTSSREYLLDGYEVDANGYILKPYSEEEINRVMGRALKEIDYENRNIIFIKSNKNVYKIPLNKVLYFESFLRKVKVNLKDGAKYEFYEKLDNLDEKLRSKHFIRIHRSFLVNAYYIKQIEEHDLILITGESLHISRGNINIIRELFMEYIDKQWEY